MTPDQITKAVNSAVVVANAAELAAHVIKNVAGNDISDSLNGSTVTMATVRDIAISRIRQSLKLK